MIPACVCPNICLPSVIESDVFITDNTFVHDLCPLLESFTQIRLAVIAVTVCFSACKSF